jgi:hypothetical protein
MFKSDNSVTINVSVITKSQKESISINDDGSLKMKINEAPEKGKANEKIIKLIAKRLKISKNKIKIVKGEYSNKKLILINNFNGSISELID